MSAINKNKKKENEREMKDNQERIENSGNEQGKDITIESPEDIDNEKNETDSNLSEDVKEVDMIEKLNEEIAALKDKNLRIMAEFENFRKRTISEKSSWIKNATERLVLELCDVVDNFERAINLANEKHEFNSLFDGIKLIYQQMDTVLKKEGVKRIETKDETFDPKIHEALAHIPSELDEGVIAAVIQNGYLMNDKIIRPAKVAVSNGQKPINEIK